MNNKNKIFALSLSLLMLVGITSCGETTSESTEPDYVDPTYNPFGKYEETVSVKGIMEYLAHNDSRVPTNITPDNQVFITKLKEDLNVDFKYMWKAPSTQYENKLTSSMLSKNFPDIVKLNASQYQSFKKRGLLKDLTEAYKYASPAVKAFLERDPSVVKSLRDEDGKIYAIPQYDDINREVPVMYYRKDWLQEDGLTIPKTPEELKAVLTSFKTKHSADAGLGLSKSFFGSYFTLDRYMQTFGSKPFSWVKTSDNKLIASEITDNAKEGLNYLKDLYDNGLMARDFASSDASSVEANLKNGKTGIVYGPWWQFEYPIGDLLPTQDWACAPIPTKEGVGIVLPKQQISSYYVCTKDFKHPEILMKMLNFYVNNDGKPGCNAEDGYVWSWCPTQFYDPFEVDTQHKNINAQLEIDPKAEGAAPEEWTAHTKKLWNAYPDYLVWKEDHGAIKFQSNMFANIVGRVEQDGAWASILKTREINECVFNEYTDLPTDAQKDFGGQTSTHTEKYFVKAIMGEKNVTTDWDAYVKEWNSLGGEKITKEVNDWYVSKA